jgi:PAS domain S-box-containing protein
MEQLLKTNTRKYTLLSENINDGIFICRNGCFEYVNKALNHLFGFDEQELIGLKITQLVLPEYMPELNFVFTLEVPLNQIRNLEIECSKKDGSVIFVEFLFNYVAKEGVIYGVAHDITEKRQSQRNMVKAIILTEEKERAHFSKELHDGLGPLLSAIKLYLQWSERSKSDESRDEIIHKAEEILEEALKAVKEISNKLSPHLLTNYGLRSAIQSFVNKLEESSEVKIAFNCNLSKRLGDEIEAAVYRAMIECLNNTIKHSGAKNITIDLIDTGNELQVQYEDDGIGFNPKKTIAAKRGLGLFNLQNRIQSIGGTIGMFSKPGKGVKYQITVKI